MNYLIPDWSVGDTDMESDPIINLARIFRDHEQPSQLLLLRAAPGLRYQLHHNHLLDVSWWNVFDAIQGIQRKEGLPRGLNDLVWPAGAPIRFVYDASKVHVFQGADEIAMVFFHRDGFVWRVEWRRTGEHYIDQYDDRGFLVYRQWLNGQQGITKTVWYDTAGRGVMRQTDHIMINPVFADRFQRPTYDQLEDVVGEFAERYLRQDEGAKLVAATSPAMQAIIPRLAAVFPTYNIVTNESVQMSLPGHIQGVVAPTKRVAEALTNQNVTTITPYPTYLHLGHSTELTAVVTYWLVNSVNDDRRLAIFDQLLAFLAKDEHRQLIINSDSLNQRHELIDHWWHFVARQMGIPEDSTSFTQLRSFSNDQPNLYGTMKKEQLDAAQEWAKRLQIRVKSGFAEIADDLSIARVLVDLGSVPHLYTQITAISAGVPQINRVATGFVNDHQNGLIITDDNQLTKSLRYYLDTLSHWNEALVHNVQRIETNSEKHVLTAWKELLGNE